LVDALSDVLRAVRLVGGVFLHAEFSEPWCVLSQATPEDCRPFLDNVGHIILYHYVVEGRLLIAVDGAPAMEIGACEAVVLPHNDVHRMGSDFRLSPIPTHDIIQLAANGALPEIRYGGGGAKTRIVCGFLGCQQLGEDPLLASLPPVLRLDTRDGSAAEWIRVSFEFAAEEIAAGRSGSEAILARLSELLFVEAVRRHIDTLPGGQTGWLGGLKDPFVGRTLALIHRCPSESWTVDALAREAAMSRSALADRFTRVIGEPPMHYLLRWRMHLAAQRLRTSHDPLARIAFEVGYTSEAAFNRAFKRFFGTPPATWRKQTGHVTDVPRAPLGVTATAH
jgi:AraC-like DNA-binding protein